MAHNRRKKHKTGKKLSLSLIWGGIVAFFLLATIQLLTSRTNSVKHDDQFDDSVVAVVDGSGVLPASPKISAAPSIEQKLPITDNSTYENVWVRLEELAARIALRDENGRITESIKIAFVKEYLNGLDYDFKSWGGIIISKVNGEPVNPDTILCYINGYIPERPYIKPNCPAF